MRLARSVGGGVEYWMKLPLSELLLYMFELARQLEEEKEAFDRAQKR